MRDMELGEPLWEAVLSYSSHLDLPKAASTDLWVPPCDCMMVVLCANLNGSPDAQVNEVWECWDSDSGHGLNKADGLFDVGGTTAPSTGAWAEQKWEKGRTRLVLLPWGLSLDISEFTPLHWALCHQYAWAFNVKRAKSGESQPS